MLHIHSVAFIDVRQHGASIHYAVAGRMALHMSGIQRWAFAQVFNPSLTIAKTTQRKQSNSFPDNVLIKNPKTCQI